MNPDNMSQTNENFIKIEEEYNLSPLSGYFNDNENESFNLEYFGIDTIKAYTSCLKDMQYFNVFNLFDKW